MEALEQSALNASHFKKMSAAAIRQFSIVTSSSEEEADGDLDRHEGGASSNGCASADLPHTAAPLIPSVAQDSTTTSSSASSFSSLSSAVQDAPERDDEVILDSIAVPVRPNAQTANRFPSTVETRSSLPPSPSTTNAADAFSPNRASEYSHLRGMGTAVSELRSSPQVAAGDSTITISINDATPEENRCCGTATVSFSHVPAVEYSPIPDTLSSEVEYTLVPKWQKTMVKRGGVYYQKESGGTAQPSIYERGIAGQRRRDAKIIDMRHAQLQEEQKNATFKPRISAKARSLSRPLGARSQGGEDTHLHQLRRRLQLLELPEENSEPSFKPTLSRGSVRIVHRCRDRSTTLVSATERLYRDGFFRKKDEIDDDGAATAAAPRRVRSQTSINRHVNSLLQFERRKLEALERARAEQAEGLDTSGPLYVDAQEVVKRLTQPSVAREQRLMIAPPKNASIATRRALSSEQATEAHARGYTRWFHYWTCTEELTLDQLAYAAASEDLAASSVATRTISLLSGRGNKWDLQGFIAIMSETCEAAPQDQQIWREHPPLRNSVDGADFTFKPRINAHSENMMRGKVGVGERGGLVYNRLFLAAKSKQLAEKQKELEDQMEILVTEEQAQEKRLRQRRRRKVRQPSPSHSTESTALPVNRDLAEEMASMAVTEDHASVSSSRASSSMSVMPIQTETRSDGENITPHDKQHQETPTSYTPRCITTSPEESAEFQRFPEVHASAEEQVTELAHALTSQQAAAVELTDEVRNVPLRANQATSSSSTNLVVLACPSEKDTLRGRSTGEKAALDLILECARCRRSGGTAPEERAFAERQNQRRLRRLGQLLHSQYF